MGSRSEPVSPAPVTVPQGLRSSHPPIVTMPFKAPEQIKCPRCGKSVYAAEARAVGELSFHKECFKCSMCNKMLDSTNQNCHERVLYCKTCHGRKFGPKSYGFGAGAAGLSTDTGAHLELN